MKILQNFPLNIYGDYFQIRKQKKILENIKVTKKDFKDFSSIPTIPDHFEKSMVLYIMTWQKMPDDNQNDTMTTKPEWFIEFENKQEQQEFNQQILSLIS